MRSFERTFLSSWERSRVDTFDSSGGRTSPGPCRHGGRAGGYRPRSVHSHCARRAARDGRDLRGRTHARGARSPARSRSSIHAHAAGGRHALPRLADFRLAHTGGSARGAREDGSGKQRLRAANAGGSRGRLHVGRARRPRHRAGKQGGDQRCRGPLHRPHRILRGAHRRRPRGHDARGRRHARCARDHASRAARRAGGDHARLAHAHAATCCERISHAASDSTVRASSSRA